jgi:hypothetical protein
VGGHWTGVFAQSDKLYDVNFEDEGRKGPRWRLEERLRGDGDDHVHLAHGFVAVKNRNSRSLTKKDEDISGCWTTESRWFQKESAFREDAADNQGVVNELNDRLGLYALLQKIDKVFCKHLNDQWVPREQESIDLERAVLASKLDWIKKNNGMLQNPESGLVFIMRERLVRTVFTYENVDQVVSEFVRAELASVAASVSQAHNLFQRIVLVRTSFPLVDKCLRKAASEFSRIFREKMTSEFSRDPEEGCIDLRPFKDLWHHVFSEFDASLKKHANDVVEHRSGKCQLELSLQKGQLLSQTTTITGWNGNVVENVVRGILLEHVLFPLVGPKKVVAKDSFNQPEFELPWLSGCSKNLKTHGSILFTAEIEDLERKVASCDAVKKSLTELLCHAN